MNAIVNPTIGLYKFQEMIRISAQYFYWQASGLHPLATVTAGEEIDTACYSKLFQAQTVLKAILTEKAVPLRLCAERGWSLHATVVAMINKLGKGERIDPLEAYQITDGLRQFETVLAAELAQMDMYFVSQKGCYSTLHLITEAESMLPESVKAHLPKDATEDIRQAGKCLAFELPTAAAFHILRATESVLHVYFDVISSGKPRPKTRNMGKYIEALEKVDTVDEKVLGVLRQIKNLHRNPIMHPDVSLDMNEALILIGIANSAITAMVTFVSKHKATALLQPPATPPLSLPAVSTP